jgi:hypothetical protein
MECWTPTPLNSGWLATPMSIASDAKKQGRTVRTIFGLAVAVLAVSSPAFSQPTCDDDAVLQQFVATYFGVSEFRGMTEARIRDKIIAAPEMLHWRGMAKENEVGEAIANWVINTDVRATILAQYLVRSITATPSSNEPNSNMYTCQATLEFDNGKLISYLTLQTLNSWLQSANGIHVLDLAASMNDMGKWLVAEYSLSSSLRQIAERMASCVRKQVTFTVEPSKSDFNIGLDSMPAYDQDCVMRSWKAMK